MTNKVWAHLINRSSDNWNPVRIFPLLWIYSPSTVGQTFIFILSLVPRVWGKKSISSSVAYARPSTLWSPNELVPMVPPGPCAGTHAREVPAWCQGYHLRPICPLSLIRQCESVALLPGDFTKSHILWPRINSTWRSLGFFFAIFTL